MFSNSRHPLVTFGFWRQSIFPVNGEPLISLKKKKKKQLTDNLPTSRRQPHLTTYQLLVMQTLCGVQRAAGELGKLNSHLSSASAHYYNISHLATMSIFLRVSVPHPPAGLVQGLHSSFVVVVDMFHLGPGSWGGQRSEDPLARASV